MRKFIDKVWFRYIVLPALGFSVFLTVSLLTLPQPVDLTVTVSGSLSMAFFIAVIAWWLPRLGQHASRRISSISIICFFLAIINIFTFYIFPVDGGSLVFLIEIVTFVPGLLGFLYLGSEIVRAAGSQVLRSAKGTKTMGIGALCFLAFAVAIVSINNMTRSVLNFQILPDQTLNSIRRLGELTGQIIAGVGLVQIRDIHTIPPSSEIKTQETREPSNERIGGLGIGLVIIGLSLGYFSIVALYAFLIMAIGIILFALGVVMNRPSN